ncbi:hypothetical protein [Nocardia farcinica]|uniref:hypothetical protein n=1 Tax=Nocardia farcinica TaxID=37329 RepID=UPI00344151B4
MSHPEGTVPAAINALEQSTRSEYVPPPIHALALHEFLRRHDGQPYQFGRGQYRRGEQGSGQGEVYDSARCRSCGHRRDWHYRGRSGCEYGPRQCNVDCREFLSPVLEDMELCECGHRREVHGGPCWTTNDISSSAPDCGCQEFTARDARKLTSRYPAGGGD